MISIQLQIIVIACLVSIVCVLPGVFLVLRGVALMSDAISHAILLGIAVMFLIVQRLDSPLLILGASLAGILTVVCTEWLIFLKSLKKDAAIGIVFPLFFSIGVLLITKYARNVHLDTDMILLGEISFAPFNRLEFYGYDCGPYALWLLLGILILNGLFITVFYKELTLITFDQEYAKIIGSYPTFFYYALMTLTSITAVAAFDIVGAIVVVALMITPPATAYLVTNTVSNMYRFSLVFGILSAIIGYFFAHALDVSIAGSIATVTGIFFLMCLFFSPIKGIFAYILVQRINRVQICKKIVLSYLAEQQNTQENYFLCSSEIIAQIFNWEKKIVQHVVEQALKDGFIDKKGNMIFLTKKGYEYTKL
jgi:manganese/zinc/iron transport system permease protein